MIRKLLPKSSLRDKVEDKDISTSTEHKSQMRINHYLQENVDNWKISIDSENAFAKKLKLQVIVSHSGMRA